MFKLAIKTSLIATVITLSGCSLYMAPWEKPNPYHYEVLQEPQVVYPPSQIQDSNLNFTPLTNSPLESPMYENDQPQGQVANRSTYYTNQKIQPQVQIDNRPMYQQAPVYNQQVAPIYNEQQPVYNQQPSRVYNSTDEMYQNEPLSIPIQ